MKQWIGEGVCRLLISIAQTLQRPIWGYIGQQDGGGRRGGVEEAALRGQNCSQGDHLAQLEHLVLHLQYSLNPFRRIETHFLKKTLLRFGKQGWTDTRRRQSYSNSGTKMIPNGKVFHLNFNFALSSLYWWQPWLMDGHKYDNDIDWFLKVTNRLPRAKEDNKIIKW